MNRRSRERILIFVLVALCLVPVAQFTRLVARTIASAADLEHGEGEMVMGICDLKDGLALYPDHLSSRVAFNYAPLYYWISAPFTACAAPGVFLGGRLVSLLSFLLTLALLPLCVWTLRAGHRSKILVTSLLLVFLSLTLFKPLGAWYFLARTDMLALGFAAASWAILRNGRGSTLGFAAAGLAQALAVASKQSFILQVPLLALAAGEMPLFSRRNLNSYVYLTAPTALVVFGMYLAGGIPLLHYTFTLPGQQGLVRRLIVWFWVDDLPRTVLIEALVAAVYLYRLYRRRAADHRELIFTGAFLAAFVANSYSSRFHSGAYLNCLIPGVFAIVVVASKVIAGGLIDLAQKPLRIERRLCGFAGALVLMVGLGLFRGRDLSAFALDPATADFTAAFVRLARRHTIYFTEIPQINRQAGTYDPAWPMQLNAFEFFRFNRLEFPTLTPGRLPKPIQLMEDLIANQRFDFILSDGFFITTEQNRLPRLALVDAAILCQNYRYVGRIKYPSERTMIPPTGAETRPNVVLVRQRGGADLARAFAKEIAVEDDRGSLREMVPGCLERPEFAASQSLQK